MAIHNQIGKIGEHIAAKALQSKGYHVDHINWTMGHLEMDIIASNRKEIAFVEVKTRTTLFGGKLPEEAVNRLKKARMVAAANAYIKYYRIEKKPRFDVIGILLNSETKEVVQLTHLENAFQPAMRTINKESFTGHWRWGHRTKIIQ